MAKYKATSNVGGYKARNVYELNPEDPQVAKFIEKGYLVEVPADTMVSEHSAAKYGRTRR